MLVLLEIQDFGLIDRASIEFTPGLNVLTGETGAGKSIIIEALQVVLGLRASAEFIRSGKERARVTAVFDLNENAPLKEKLTAWGIPGEEGTLVMARELTRSGRNTCRLNGQAVTVGLYREAGRYLVALQEQHEQQVLLNPEHQMDLLDLFGGARTGNIKKNLQDIYDQWRDSQARRDEIWRNAKDRARRLDLLRYQIEEIGKANFSAGEEEELFKERLRLTNIEKILLLAGECYNLLQENEGTARSCALDCLGQARRHLNELIRLDDALTPVLTAVESAFYQIEEAVHELASYREKIQSDPQRLQFIEDRLALLRALKRKYGDTIADLLRYREEASREYAQLAASEESAAVFERELSRLEDEWQKVARELTQIRQEAARRLEEAIALELATLEMAKVKFFIKFEQLEGISPFGRERIEFLISPNPGEPLRPLVKIVSGGELSRIMLAARTILAALDAVPVLVFDEVDTGIGGRTLQAVAEKLAQIATHVQVICVTHAAQVACQASNHCYVFKEVRDEQTIIFVKALRGEELTNEIARLLAGKVNGLAWEHARQLLKQGMLARERF